jgi:hypothetical protein
MIDSNHSNQCQYFYIRAWAKFRNTSESELNWLLKKAQVTLAPWDAMYRHTNGMWQTFSNARNEEVKTKVHKIYSVLLKEWFDEGEKFRSSSRSVGTTQNNLQTMP